MVQGSEECIKHIDPTAKEVSFNPKFEELFSPMVGPENPFKTQQQQSSRNMLSGYVEPAYVSEFQFENQRRTFNSFGYALDPTVGSEGDGTKIITTTGQSDEINTDAKTVFESTKLRPLDKRKRKKNNDPSDIEGFLGPWGGFIDEQRVMKPSEEEAAELEELASKKNKKGKPIEEKPIEEKSILHSKVVNVSGFVSFNELLQFRIRWIIKGEASCMLLKMLGLISSRIRPPNGASCQKHTSTLGRDTPRESQRYAGFPELLICCCLLVWTVELRY
jgi:hypothetical protein